MTFLILHTKLILMILILYYIWLGLHRVETPSSCVLCLNLFIFSAKKYGRCDILSASSKAVSVMFIVVNTLLVLVTMWSRITSIESLRTAFTRQPLLGHQCVLDNTTSLTIWLNTFRPQCVWRCLSTESCLVVSHNHRLNYCELSTQLCDRIEPNPDFSVNIYGMDRRLCISWVPDSEHDPERAVEFIRIPGIKTKIAVSRIQNKKGSYPGKQRRFGKFDTDAAVNASTYVRQENAEVLLVDSACRWLWLAYKAPNALPVGAVEGGYAEKEPLYIARQMHNNLYTIGYYKSSAQLGYFVNFDQVKLEKDMKILVIIWHQSWENTQGKNDSMCPLWLPQECD